jgi:acyl-[acyl-carrier-protein]-phospholipid O-acyltransferase / long-chain-fatty-acid--[acyl-carrier-protein] ligase
MKSLLRIAGFGAFICAVFLNAFVDLGHKILIQNTLFKVYDGETQVMLTALVNALILIPFVLLFTPSGYLADRFAKTRVMRMSAWVAVGLTLVITFSYYQGWFELAFAMTFLLAAQSAILSPAKYGYIRELAGTDQLASANGVVQATTTTAILGGIFVFSIFFENRLAGQTYSDAAQLLPHIAPLGWLLVLGSLLETWFTYRLPERRGDQPSQPFDWSDYLTARSLNTNLRSALSRPVIRLSVIGLSLFWAISQVVLAVFPAFAKDSLQIDNTVVIQGLLACSGIGIIFGSLIASRLSRGHIETGMLPLAAIGIGVSLAWMPGLGSTATHALNFLALGTLGGLFLVPLNALIQYHAGEQQLGKVLAANNLVQNVVMLAFLGLTAVAALRFVPPHLMIAALAAIAFAGAAYTLYKLPQSLLRLLVARVLSLHYRLQVQGLHHLPSQGGVLLLGNHISWLDWAMVQMASPRPVRFVMERSIYQRRLLRPFLDLFGAIPISAGSSREALQAINEALNAGEVVCLFPEGAISRSGQLGKFHKGFEQAAHDADAQIVPFYLRGLWGSRFSRAGEKLKLNRRSGLTRDVVVAFGQPLPIDSNAPQVKQAVSELSVDAWQAHVATLPTLPDAWLKTAKQLPGNDAVIDSIGLTLSHRRFAAATLRLSTLIGRRSPERNLGILLPASSAGAMVNMAALVAGKTLVNLNFTASREAVGAALEQAQIRLVYTSRRFLDRLRKKGMDVDGLFAGVELICLEDLREQIGGIRALPTLLAFSLLPTDLLSLLYVRRRKASDTAAILFSSGSEGQPKGVELTHTNLMANLTQVADMLDTRAEDRIMASLPLFHAFGLTVTTLLPLIEGIPMVCHPDPSDALNVAKAIARYRATILCGTSTFLRLYARNRRVHPLMLDSLRIVVAGAERLSPEVREAFTLKFGKAIYEGYGTTETTPVASVNLPDRLDTRRWAVQAGGREGTVGMPLPGSSFRIVDPDTLEALPAGEDGLILIGGVQVMKGYLADPQRTADAVVELDGQRWYKTGDKGHLDVDGFLTIVDRYSRFAKIGGEMVSLSVVEQQARDALAGEEAELVAVQLPDPKKGDRIVLLCTADIATEELRERLLKAGCNPLSIPSQVQRIEALPLLGSGKVDFARARQLALSLVEQAGQEDVA